MTDEERCEVAARLRWIDAKDDPMNSALMLDKIRRAIDDHMDAPSAFPPYEWWVTRAHVTFNRLADLIEPEERTCRAGVFPDGAWAYVICCTECGYAIGGTWSDIGTARRMARAQHKFTNFCPNCGARVIQE